MASVFAAWEAPDRALTTLLVLDDPQLIQIPLDDLPGVLEAVRDTLRGRHADIWARLEAGRGLEDGDRESVGAVLAERLKQLRHGAGSSTEEPSP